MVTGTHNSMSYLPVTQWWLRPFRIWGRCQRLTLDRQLDAGARYFDLRIKFDSKGRAQFGHGLITYRADDDPATALHRLLERAASAKADIYVRILLEQRATRERRRLFAEWLDSNLIVHWLDLRTAGWEVGHKNPYGLIYPATMGTQVVEVFKHYDKWWQFAIPPCGWLKQQREALAKARQRSGAIVSMDFFNT